MTERTKRILRVSSISLAVLALLIGAAVWYVASNIEKIARNTLIEEVKKSTNGLYTLQMGVFNLSLANGVLRINDISIQVDSSKLYQLELKGEKPEYTISFSAKSLEVDLDRLLKIWRGRKLQVKYISVVEPNIKLFLHSNKRQKTLADSTNVADKRYQKLPFFSSAAIEKADLINGCISYYDQRNSETRIFHIKDFSFKAEDIKIDSLINLQNPLTHLGSATVEANGIQHYLLSNALLFSIKRISANLRDSLVTVDSLSITPQYEKYEFARKTPNHNDIIYLSVKSIMLSGIHFNELLSHKKLTIGSITMDNFYFWSFKNKKIPPVILKEKPLFHKLIHRIRIPVLITSLTVNNGKASYEELSLNGKTPGKIDFTDISLEVNGLTNIATPKSQLYTAKARGKVYGEGMLEVAFRLPVDPLNDYFELEGHLGKMDLTAINQMAIPLAFLEIASGTAQRMDFSISGNSKTSKTDMTFLYNNLKVELLNSNKNSKERKFLSGLVNTLVIRSNNPLGNREPKRATGIISERERFLSNFNYWWRGIRDGMLSSLGVPGK